MYVFSKEVRRSRTQGNLLGITRGMLLAGVMVGAFVTELQLRAALQAVFQALSLTH
jgi:hypothetical protein